MDINQVDSRTMLKDNLKQLSAGDFSTPVILKMVAATAFAGDGYGSAYNQPDNDLLDIKKMEAGELKKTSLQLSLDRAGALRLCREKWKRRQVEISGS